LKLCLFEDGDLSEEFGMDENLNVFTDMGSGFDEFFE